jgi:hypothetical protein
MTPKPDNLPKDPADMTLSQVLQECARILHNAGGAERGAGDSAELANAALRWAENLPGWRPIGTAKRGVGVLGRWSYLYPGDKGLTAGHEIGEVTDDGGFRSDEGNHHAGLFTYWYDFGHGQPMPPAPEGGE